MPTTEDMISQEEIDALLGRNYITSNSDIQKFKKRNDIKKPSGMIGHIDYSRTNPIKRNIITKELIDSKMSAKSGGIIETQTGSVPVSPDTSVQTGTTPESAPTAAEAHVNPQDGGGQSTQSKPSTTAVEPTQPGPAASTPKPASAPTGGAQPAAPTTDGQPASPEKLTDLQKQFREKFPLKSEPKPEPSKAVKAGFFSEKAFIPNFDENFSLTNARKRQLLETKWNKTLDEISPGAKRYTDKSMKRAMEKFSNDYNLGVDLSNYKTSMLGRIANRVRGNKNISKEEALERTLGAYSKKTNEYINNLKEQYQSGKITDRQYMRRANRGWTRAAANGGERVPKSRNLEKLGWKGKGLAAVGLVALGGVISNMFSGGKKSNAELYNPNPQPQYYS